MIRSRHIGTTRNWLTFQLGNRLFGNFLRDVPVVAINRIQRQDNAGEFNALAVIRYPSLAFKNMFQSIIHNLPLGTGKEHRPVIERERAHRVELAANRVQGTTLMVSGRM